MNRHWRVRWFRAGCNYENSCPLPPLTCRMRWEIKRNWYYFNNILCIEGHEGHVNCVSVTASVTDGHLRWQARISVVKMPEVLRLCYMKAHKCPSVSHHIIYTNEQASKMLSCPNALPAFLVLCPCTQIIWYPRRIHSVLALSPTVVSKVTVGTSSSLPPSLTTDSGQVPLSFLSKR